MILPSLFLRGATVPCPFPRCFFFATYLLLSFHQLFRLHTQDPSQVSDGLGMDLRKTVLDPPTLHLSQATSNPRSLDHRSGIPHPLPDSQDLPRPRGVSLARLSSPRVRRYLPCAPAPLRGGLSALRSALGPLALCASTLLSFLRPYAGCKLAISCPEDFITYHR